MADSTTPLKKIYINNRQRTSDQDLNEVHDLTQDLIANNMYGLIADDIYNLYGWHVTHSASRDFSMSEGAGIKDGNLYKTIAALIFTLDENPSGDPRMDRIEFTGLSDQNSDDASKHLMSAISRNDITGHALGTGDGNQKHFDLPQSLVDIRTLRIQVAGTKAGGWSLSFGTGTAGKDEVIFHTAPGVGEAVVADGHYHVGGSEASQTVKTRRTITPTLNIIKGTPNPTPSMGAGAWTTDSLKVCEITIPPGWTGGPTSVSIENKDVKSFMVNVDNVTDNDSPADGPHAGKVVNAIRHMNFISAGLRAWTPSTDKIRVSPGWGCLLGVAFYVPVEMELTVSGLSPNEWYYLYAEVYQLSLTQPGFPPTLVLSSDAPTNRRVDPGGTNYRRFYLGAFYATAADAVRPCYTRGAWTYWKTPVAISLSDLTGTKVDLPITAWIPETADLFDARIMVNAEANTVGDRNRVEVFSHKQATSLAADPRLQTVVMPPVTGYQLYDEKAGMLKAEHSGAVTRSVHYLRTHEGTSPSGADASLYVQGYLDDWRAMNSTGNGQLY